MPDRVLQVMNLRPGMKFLWAGHAVKFLRAQDHTQSPVRKVKRRRLIVETGDGKQHGLWYEDKERVTLVVEDA